MNLFPAHLIEKIINRYITGTQSNHHPRGSLPTTSPTFYFKLPYIGHFSAITQKKRSAILLGAIAMTWISNWFSLPSKSVTCLVWKTLSLTGSVHVWFISLYVLAVMPDTSVKPAGIFSTSVREHLVSDRASHIFKHLKDSAHCRALCSADNFHVLDRTSTGFQLKIKEATHIQREQPSMNQQLHHVNLKLSF